MINMRFKISLLLVGALSLLEGVAARKGGAVEIFGCVYFPDAPRHKIVIDFAAGDPWTDNCMISTGKDTSMTVSKEGLTCTSMGIIQGKHSSSNGDHCADEDSTWSLSYAGGGYAGSTMAIVRTNPWVSRFLIYNESIGTNACLWPELYLSFESVWATGGDASVYVIFQPIVEGKIHGLSDLRG